MRILLLRLLLGIWIIPVVVLLDCSVGWLIYGKIKLSTDLIHDLWYGNA